MQEFVLSIATNSSILSVNRLYKTFEDNMIYKSKDITQVFQHCKHYVSLSLIQNYEKFNSSFPKRPRTSSTKDGASPQQYIWAMVTEKAPPSGTYHMSCIYVLQSRDTDAHIKKMHAIPSCFFAKSRKHDFCSKRLTKEFASGKIFITFKLEIIK